MVSITSYLGEISLCDLRLFYSPQIIATYESKDYSVGLTKLCILWGTQAQT